MNRCAEIPLEPDEPALPWSCEAEQSVLGGMLLDPDALVRMADVPLRAEHFFDAQHRAIWAAMQEMAARRQPIDVVTVFERLQSAGRAEDCGGVAYVNALAQAVPSATNIRRHAEIVREKALQREVIAAADRALTIARQPGGDAASKLDQVATLFAQIARPTARSAPRRLAELMTARLGHWQALQEGDATPGIPTGLDRLDNALAGGLKPGKVVVLAARPSVGKTSFAQQLGLTVAAGGHTVLMLSQEMPAGELVDRVMANLGGVDLGHLSTGGFEDADWTAISAAADDAGRPPFLVDDQPALTLLDIRAKARQVQQRDGLALLIVDYLQLCAGSAAFDKRHHQIEQISRGLKQLAKELDICVLALSQLSRQSARRADGEPELDDLKESGAIEEDADTVILLHAMGNQPDGSTLVLAKIPKNRSGRRGRLALQFTGKTQRWAASTANVSRRRDSGDAP
jgi:replicative DNA helicase